MGGWSSGIHTTCDDQIFSNSVRGPDIYHFSAKIPGAEPGRNLNRVVSVMADCHVRTLAFDGRAHFGGGVELASRTHQVLGAITVEQHGVHGRLDKARVLFEFRSVAEQHGRGVDRADRISDALTCDVRSGAMYWLVEIDFAADGGGSQKAERSAKDCGLVGKDVAEEVLGKDHVEGRGSLDQPHGKRINQRMLEFHVGILLGYLVHDLPPELR